MNKSFLKYRKVKNKLFEYVCISGIITALLLLSILVLSILYNSRYVLQKPVISVEYNYALTNDINKVNYNIWNAVSKELSGSKLRFSEYEIKKIVSLDAGNNFLKSPRNGKIYVDASGLVGQYLKESTIFSDEELKNILEYLRNKDLIKLVYSFDIFTNTDSREPESAGLLGGLVGSLMIVFSCLIFAIPLGVISAIYLEEFSKDGYLKNMIEININNLAAVPSIVYGLIGLFLLVVHFHLPRSSAIAAGVTLGFLILPTIIVCTRQAIRNIPKNIKQGALALGASPMQVTLHHVLPLATPGIITGAILSISRAIGETAPLIMLGMVAFIPDIPASIFDPTSALPVLIYTWSDSPEYAFVEKVSSAILLLIVIIISLNYFAIGIRNKYQKRW